MTGNRSDFLLSTLAAFFQISTARLEPLDWVIDFYWEKRNEGHVPAIVAYGEAMKRLGKFLQ